MTTYNDNVTELLAKADEARRLARKDQDVNYLRHVKAELVEAAEAADPGSVEADAMLNKAEPIDATINDVENHKGQARRNSTRLDFGPNGPDAPKPNKPKAYQPLRAYDATNLDALDDGDFEGLSDFLRAVRNAQQGQGFDQRLLALTTQSNNF